MDNQNNTQINNTTKNAQPNQPVESQPAINTEAPVNSAGNTPPKTGNKLLLYLAGAAVVLVLILAAVFLFGFLGNSNKKENIVQQSQPTTAPAQLQEEQGVSQEPITNQQDVTNALQQVENSNPDAVGAGLGQNTIDASSFSQ
ncbi:MAG: hypothetical protein A3H50_00860 [Candidatus Levybacteria bacterium RIFCSPLOWO2_02_FULL_37_10]|nr:MAG: hypothetical protein A2860_03420 [Candidatus Levybacteria bacterium RIFCSPHIGHO2_01_FULL_37_33]OGH16404.1 MAG: hypothetical protein A3C97_02725 [Candidatus Levybacteria bacterium RIFCSPHIGHO2_02_FULL_37_11]OGH30286.1 MAG: hypothetical protein A3F30_03475 [Candidatus Levybacteria bacterium RIFCSPHIGHO2_12_FULL_37_12]OGH43153.1 MAG: hypothetical protein A3H50_00860 [Candidatus Levybacteria bacterium RIFCSPLOWO2_02_FULL_37_10]